MTWQLQEAKQKFSELVKRALQDGPQLVTRHGEEVVVVLSVAAYQKLRGGAGQEDFKSFLLGAPDLEGLELERDPRPAPQIEW
jgi:prevent-host-death family protein